MQAQILRGTLLTPGCRNLIESRPATDCDTVGEDVRMDCCVNERQILSVQRGEFVCQMKLNCINRPNCVSCVIRQRRFGIAKILTGETKSASKQSGNIAQSGGDSSRSLRRLTTTINQHQTGLTRLLTSRPGVEALSIASSCASSVRGREFKGKGDYPSSTLAARPIGLALGSPS